MAAATLYEISDADSGALLDLASVSVPEALDAVCDRLAAELRANAEGSSAIRYRLAIHAIASDGARTWCGQRLHYPSGPGLPGQQSQHC